MSIISRESAPREPVHFNHTPGSITLTFQGVVTEWTPNDARALAKLLLDAARAEDEAARIRMGGR